MPKSNEPNRMIMMTIIAGLVLLTLTLISRSACAICFCQPSEPIALQRVIRESGKEKMKKVNSVILKFSSSLAALALMVGVSSAASACFFWFNQPEMPEVIEKFRKDN